MEKAKAEGTYMTKAQREKAARAKAALEAMRSMGLVSIPAEGEEGEGAEKPGRKKPAYAKPRKKKAQAAGGEEQQQQQEPQPQDEAPETPNGQSVGWLRGGEHAVGVASGVLVWWPDSLCGAAREEEPHDETPAVEDEALDDWEAGADESVEVCVRVWLVVTWACRAGGVACGGADGGVSCVVAVRRSG